MSTRSRFKKEAKGNSECENDKRLQRSRHPYPLTVRLRYTLLHCSITDV